ncbi:hypothetical protein ACTFIV_006431 [Dictyostelium citrinum]
MVDIEEHENNRTEGEEEKEEQPFQEEYFQLPNLKIKMMLISCSSDEDQAIEEQSVEEPYESNEITSDHDYRIPKISTTHINTIIISVHDSKTFATLLYPLQNYLKNIIKYSNHPLINGITLLLEGYRETGYSVN